MRTTLQSIALSLCAVFVMPAMPPSDTPVSIIDTLYLQSATGWNGDVTCSWPAFTASGGTQIAKGSRASTAVDGAVNIALYSTVGASPSFLYTCRYRSTDAASRNITWTETWYVPASGPVVLNDVRRASTIGIGFTYAGPYSGRPASPHTRDAVLFTDATSTGSCATSGGTSYAMCVWTGAAWAQAGGGGSSSTWGGSTATWGGH